MTTPGPGSAGPTEDDMTDFIIIYAALLTIIMPGCIVLGALGWLSDRISIGGPRR